MFWNRGRACVLRSSSVILLLLAFSCAPKAKEKPVVKEVSLGGSQANLGPQKLSEWGLFKVPLRVLSPEHGVIEYDLNTPLFSDYAFKKRFVKLPSGQKAGYSQHEVLNFPLGTILIKNFYYPLDFRKPEAPRRILETRLLIKEEVEWKALTYVWNEEQTEAFLEVSGRSIPVSWTDEGGVLKSVNYSVPNLNQCKGCHEYNGKLTPIGPSVRQLNKPSPIAQASNQLEWWTEAGMLTDSPSSTEWEQVPNWNDAQSGTLDASARAWLEINCAHCHRPEGPAKNTGLYLTYAEKDPYKLGINKPPVAAGRGSAGLKYSVVPGSPESSILYHRISSLDPGVMMPELGRKLNHEEGLTLIKEWITQMPQNTKNTTP